jgi:branched-subunit amino acid aminotransferase/4-amino-4-deoxychorismate lyase
VSESGADGPAVAGPWPAGAAWIDGGYRPIEEAKISVLDLGVTRSDCTYDVVHVWDGRFYRLDAHLDRFGSSLARRGLTPDTTAPGSRPSCTGASAAPGCGKRMCR